MHRFSMFTLAGVAALALLGCGKDGKDSTAPPVAEPAANPEASLRPLTVDEVAARIATNDGKTFVYDNNPKDSWVKSHVPGARWLDESTVTATDLPADKAATLIFYCHNET